MKELSYKYKSIEEKLINGKEVHKVKDIFNDKEYYVEKYKEINDMDWDGTTELESELDKLKNNNKIEDFFYYNDYQKDLKVFYKVFTKYDNFEKKEEENTIPTSENTEEKEHSIRASSNANSTTIVASVAVQHHPQEKKEEDFVGTSPNASSPEKKIEKIDKKEENKVYKINEIGGTVKITSPSIKEEQGEDIFEAPLLKKTITKNKTSQNLELNFKKSRSRVHINDKIICKRCEEPIKTEKMDFENNIAYCDNCHAIRQIKTLKKEEEAQRNIGIMSPDGIYVKNTKTKLYIETELNKIAGFGYVLGASIMLMISLMGETTGELIFLTTFSIILGYFGLIKLLNKIKLDITKQKIIIKSTPLFHFPVKTFESSRISQIYVKEHIHRNKNGTTYTYKVRAILKNGKDKVLVKLDNPEYAVYLERSIETWLGIIDRHVSGEFK